MADGAQRGFIEIWELALATMFFVAVLSAILVVFDEENYEKNLFSKDLQETILIMPENTSISFNKPEFIIVNIEETGSKKVIRIKNDLEDENPISFETTKPLSLQTNSTQITLKT